MKKENVVSKVYKIVMAIYSALFGAALLSCLAEAFFAGPLFDPTSDRLHTYTFERMSQYAIGMIAPLIIFIGLIIFGIVWFNLHPSKENVFAKPTSIALLDKAKRVKINDIEDIDVRDGLLKLRASRYWLLGLGILVSLFFFAVIIIYISNGFFYTKDSNLVLENLNLFKHIFPFVGIGLMWLVVAIYSYNEVSQHELDYLKKYKLYKLERKLQPVFNVKKEVRVSIIWTLRIVVLAIAITFIILGIFNGGANDVFKKAANICTECIGLG